MNILPLIRVAAIAILVFTTIPYITSAQDNSLSFGGELYIDNRVRTEDGAWSWNENRLNLELNKDFNNRASMFGNVWLRSFGLPVLNQSEQLFNKDEISPYNIEIREAYVELYDFLLDGLDVRIGRQRIAWGTGDLINPTDNLNPDDLEDIWDFGRHSGSDGIRARYYFSDFHLELDYLPFFRPAVLPRGDWAEAIAPPIKMPAGIIIRNFSDSLAMPAYNLAESSTYGIRLGGFLAGYDLSVSYVYGRDDLPIQYYNTVSFAEPPNIIDIRSELYFPRQHVFGADISGAIGSVGIWGEMGVFLPEEEVVMTTDLSQVLQPSTDSVLLKKEAFVKYVLGADYTFRDGSYINLQFFHGFVSERGQGMLNDYLMLSWEKNFFNYKLKVTPVAGAFIINDWDNPADNHAWIYAPFINYYPNINTDISLGVRLIGGEGDNMFALVKNKDEVFLSVKFSF
ncbi:MAG: hypothetical protein RQ761_05545 [Bacteroidales bacterium]|nr:hypothetical protein [Bacteroidales bacterium]